MLSIADTQLQNQTSCADGYQLKYTLPMFHQCPMKNHAERGLIQTIPKLIPIPTITNNCPIRQNRLGILEGRRVCKIPDCSDEVCKNGWCEETTTGFTCHSSDVSNDSICENDSLIDSVRLLGDNTNEGVIMISSRTMIGNATTYMLIEQDGWNSDASRLVCQYLGFEGVYATLIGKHFNVSSLDNNTQSAIVECPDNATAITECWYNETRVGQIETSIGVICCSVNRVCRSPGNPITQNMAFTPSTCYTGSTCIKASRLGGIVWYPKPQANSDDSSRWIQVRFINSIHLITAVTTKGRRWGVSSYIVSFSLNGTGWNEYLDNYSKYTKIFPCSPEMNDVTHVFEKPVLCRLFRIHVKTIRSSAMLRFELTGYDQVNDALASMNQEHGCPSPIHGEPIGIQDGRIPDSSVTCSSLLDPHFIQRLNATNTVGAWKTDYNNTDMWVKIDIGKPSYVTGVIVQGRDTHYQWVTSVFISYSMNDIDWVFALEQECGTRKEYAANFDHCSLVTILFPRPINARYVKIHPRKFDRQISMRFEVLGIRQE
ncbi:coagulation factor VIII-like [Lytechinus variegatus]|uniref:coagulation factor VIII-like n=1 Tax=Lytechinus variegatus TaxID=7654 RepID=UPI001BB26587|nr:coagulation factor VIII-like [Lytechinus variegatus]